MYKFLKIPFDAGNPTGKKGTANSPNQIFKILKKKATEVKINQSNFDESMKNIEAAALKEFKSGNQVCSVGGDHSITYPLVKAASKVHKDIALIYFDAHLDCEDDFLPPSHEDVIRAIVNKKLVKPQNIVIIGARKFWKKEVEFIKKHNIEVIYGPVGRSEIEKYLKNFSKKHKHIYISVDIDVFDPTIAPDTGYPENHGFTEEEFRKFTENLDFKRIIGLDLVEVAQSNEKEQKTITLASRVIQFLLG
jgi:agmatinase